MWAEFLSLIEELGKVTLSHTGAKVLIGDPSATGDSAKDACGINAFRVHFVALKATLAARGAEEQPDTGVKITGDRLDEWLELLSTHESSLV